MYMSENIKKITPEELENVQKVRSKYQEITVKLGQIQVQRMQITSQIEILNKTEEGLRDEWTSTQTEEQTAIQDLQEKYRELYEERTPLPPLKFETFDKPKAKPITVKPEEVKKALEKQEIDIKDAKLSEFEIFRRPQEKLTETQVEYYENGKRVVRETDKMTALALKNINPDIVEKNRAIEVDIKREIAIGKADINGVTSEEIKGKVMNKKDKLNALRSRRN